MNSILTPTGRPLPDPPRSVAVAAHAAWSRAGILLLAFLPLLSVLWFMSAGVREDLRLLHGNQATARVIDRYTFDALDPKDTMYRLNVRFTVGDEALMRAVAATRAEYARYALSDSVVVTYLPGDTTLCRLGVVTRANLLREPVDPSAWAFLRYALCALVFCSFPLWMFAPLIRREMRLLRSGVAVEATVERVETDRFHQEKTTYGFEAEGAHWTKTLYGVIAPVAGQTIPILYSPSHPDENCPAASIRFVRLRKAQRVMKEVG